MKKPVHYIVCFISLAVILSACTPPRNFPVNYYKQNESRINHIEVVYSNLSKKKPFAAEFIDKDFRLLSLEMKTDSLRYVYEFNLFTDHIRDTLHKFGYDSAAVMQVVNEMKEVRCTWINTLDYYVEGRKQMLTFMSIRHKALDIPFSPKKYFILTFYKQPQYYDAEGRLLDRRDVRRLRKVHNEVFRRINDRVCYTLSATFR